MSPTATLLLSCPDQPGLVAAVSDFLFGNGGNIVHADQHTDVEEGMFFQRVEWELDGFAIARERHRATPSRPIAERFGMRGALRFSDEVPRVAVHGVAAAALPVRPARALADRRAAPPTSRSSISNHPDHADAAEHFGVAVPPPPGDGRRPRPRRKRRCVELLRARTAST